MEAAQAAHDWFDRVIAGRTVCMITPENDRVAQDCRGRLDMSLLTRGTEMDARQDVVHLYDTQRASSLTIVKPDLNVLNNPSRTV